MGPFIEKLKSFDKSNLPQWGDWSFLRDWESPLSEDTLEELGERGKRDAKFLGRYMREQYGSLFPDPKKHKGKDRPSYKVSTTNERSTSADLEGRFGPRHLKGISTLRNPTSSARSLRAKLETTVKATAT